MAERKSLKTIVIGALIVIMAVGLSVGATLFFLSGSKAGDAAPVAAEEGSGANANAAPALYYQFEKPFITTVAQEGKSRYLQVFVALVARDPASEAALGTHSPLLRSRLLTLFGSGDFLTLQSEEGRQALKSEALILVNEVLKAEGAPPIKRVLFTNFVLQ